jgi:hypothetical protein
VLISLFFGSTIQLSIVEQTDRAIVQDLKAKADRPAHVVTALTEDVVEGAVEVVNLIAIVPQEERKEPSFTLCATL